MSEAIGGKEDTNSLPQPRSGVEYFSHIKIASKFRTEVKSDFLEIVLCHLQHVG